MKIDDFGTWLERRLGAHFSNVYFQHSSGQFASSLRPYYPTLAVFGEDDRFLFFELYGAQRKFRGLKIRKLSPRIPSVEEYLYQFPMPEGEASPAIIPASYTRMTGLCFCGEGVREKIERRFSFVELPRAVILRKGLRGSALAFNDKCTSFYAQDCMFLNANETAARMKSVRSFFLVSKALSEEEADNALNSYIYGGEKKFVQFKRTGLLIDAPFMQKDGSNILGVCFYRDDNIARISGEFATLFLTSSVRETTLGDFLRTNEAFSKKAFNAQDLVFEQEFPWSEGNPDPSEIAIRPDLMIRRSDGHYDICDLKTALVDKKKLTKGDRSRRRFIDYVNEGLAQLTNYFDYFQFKKNADWAQSKFGISVKDPKLILICGNIENFDRSAVDEALRPNIDRLRIIDYDTLCANAFADQD